jgi:F-type H+-transporting ATPase subunit b
MLIDWPTVIFQIINFLILIVLLKRFLYGPVIKAMDERERQVAARLAEAAEAKEEAAVRAAALAKEQEVFAEAREEKMLQVKEEVEKWKNDALLRLQSEVDEKREGWNSILVAEQEAFLQKLKRLVSRNVFRIARKALADLADDELEARLVNTFAAKIAKKEEGLAAVLATSTAAITCITGFPLAELQKEELARALGSYLRVDRGISFREENDLGFGIRLLSDGQKWEWNLNRYMLELETEVQKDMNSLSGVDHEQ